MFGTVNDYLLTVPFFCLVNRQKYDRGGVIIILGIIGEKLVLG
jgi:hypothetical protein